MTRQKLHEANMLDVAKDSLGLILKPVGTQHDHIKGIVGKLERESKEPEYVELNKIASQLKEDIVQAIEKAQDSLQEAFEKL